MGASNTRFRRGRAQVGAPGSAGGGAGAPPEKMRLGLGGRRADHAAAEDGFAGGRHEAGHAVSLSRLAITPSSAHKGTLDPRRFLEIDKGAKVVGPPASIGGKPSAETLLHLEVVNARGAGD